MKTALLLALALLLAAPATSAQAPALDGDGARRASAQLVASLGSPSPDVRAQSVHALLGLSRAHPDRADLRPAVPALLAAFESDPDGRVRLLALTALHASGDDGAMEALRAAVGRPAPARERRALLAALVDHYGLGTFVGDRGTATVAATLRGPLVASAGR